MAEQLPPERAVRLLRAKAAELEETVKHRDPHHPNEMVYLAADIALVATLLADQIERSDWGGDD